MPDKKLTDAEIRKALECCCDYDNNFNEMRFCQVCPLYSNRGECNELLHEYTRDLINRLQAENEEQGETISSLEREIEELYYELDLRIQEKQVVSMQKQS